MKSLHSVLLIVWAGRIRSIAFLLLCILISCTPKTDQKSNKNVEAQNEDSIEASKASDSLLNSIMDTSLNKLPAVTIDTTSTESIPIIEKVESKIIYDENFDPYVYLKIKNNSRTEIIGVSFDVTDRENGSICFKMKKAISIPFHKMRLIKEKIVIEGASCSLKNPSISLTGAVFSDGKRLDFLGLHLTEGE